MFSYMSSLFPSSHVSSPDAINHHLTPKPLVVCMHYKWLRITLPMCWDFTQATTLEATPDTPKGIYSASNVYCSQGTMWQHCIVLMYMYI